MTEPHDNPTSDPQAAPDLPRPLVAGLKALAERAPAIPAELDRAIAAAAADHLRPARIAPPSTAPAWRTARLGMAAAAALALAAAVAIPILLKSLHPSPSGSTGLALRPIGQADILPAFELARQLESGQTPDPRWDVNGDGRVDGRDVQKLAHDAVAEPIPVPVPLPEGVEQPRAAARALAEALPRFIHVDVVIDPRGRKLAAYQLHLAINGVHASIVGIESGEGDAFGQEPPYYDRQAVDSGRADRLTLAMFTTLPESKLADKPVRVATLHLMLEGPGRPAFDAKLRTAADARGRAIDAKVTVVQEEPQ